MAQRRRRIPSYRLHKSSGQAVVRIDGDDRYLGKHGSKASHDCYDRLIAEWLSSHTPLDLNGSDRPTVLSLFTEVEKFLHCVANWPSFVSVRHQFSQTQFKKSHLPGSSYARHCF